jgi:micrococcal nuclease
MKRIRRVLAKASLRDGWSFLPIIAVRWYHVQSHEDGIFAEHRERVRYIGINTPETKHPTRGVEPYGPEAATANTRLVAGHTVRLEFDVQQRDKYGRLLAYVYVGDTMINAELVRQGFAQVATFPPNVRYQERFLQLQREARDAGRGLWGREGKQ